jgi:hypothetical protein
MEDYTTKKIEEIIPGDVILDAKLQPVIVMTVLSNYLDNGDLYQFYPNGPVFTPDHQFVSNLERKEVGVVSKEALFSQLPQIAEVGDSINEFTNMEGLLQFKNGNITHDKFNVVPYEKMNTSTIVYALITTGEDGSYIANNFVTRDVLPDLEKWPWTYATLGIVLKSCSTEYPFTLEGQKQMYDMIVKLTGQWNNAIVKFGKGENAIIDEFSFDPLSQSQMALQEILMNKEKMWFAQFLQARSAKLLHQYLDSDNLSLDKQFALIKSLLMIAKEFLVCDYNMLL